MTKDSTRRTVGGFNRRTVLKGLVTAGGIGAIGTPVSANQHPRVIVGTTPGRADVARTRATEVIKTLNFGSIGQAVVGRWPQQALAGLSRNPHVRYIEEDGKIFLEGEHGQELDWGAERVGAHIAHAFGHRGNGISVAILDSGIDSRHDDLVDNLHPSLHHAPAPCTDEIGSGDCPEVWHDNDSLTPGHGTHVAGIVGAIDNAIDIIGVAPDVTLHAVKVIFGDGEGFESDLADGLEWVANNGIDVANMSLGQNNPSQTVEDAMQFAINNDVILVASAGNRNGGPVTFPGGYDQDIAVSAISEEDEISNFSSTGPEVDICAPGGSRPPQAGRDVLSTRVNGGTVRFRGTSMAAPHVAGAAALVLAAGVSPGNVKSVLQNTAEDLGLSNEEQGAGLLNIPAALDLATPTAAFTFDPALPNEGATVTFDGSGSHVDGINIVEYSWDFGDGITEATDNPVIEHSYATWGEFDVTLTVTDAAGQTDDTSQSIRINGYPIASFEVITEPVVRDEPVAFDASASTDPDGEIVEYEWDFGDGTSESTTEPTIEHTYTTGGEMTITLRVTDEDGASDDDISVHEETVVVSIRVEIAVKPGENGTRPINLRNESIVPVAVLHTSDFNSPGEIDPATVRFGTPATVDAGDGAAPLHPGGHVDDVNGSGLDDWHCHFQITETGFTADSNEAKLVGETHDGVPIFGSDEIRIVGR